MKWNVQPIYDFFGGTTETYAFVFTLISVIMAFRHILTLEFVGAISAIQVLITANDIHNDASITKVVVNNDPPTIATTTINAVVPDTTIPGSGH